MIKMFFLFYNCFAKICKNFGLQKILALKKVLEVFVHIINNNEKFNAAKKCEIIIKSLHNTRKKSPPLLPTAEKCTKKCTGKV